VTVNLDQQERDLLSAGLGEWGGPARLTNALAIALGFTDETHLHNEAKRIRTLLDDGALLTPLDAERPLAATEIVFASDVFGSGVECSICMSEPTSPPLLCPSCGGREYTPVPGGSIGFSHVEVTCDACGTRYRFATNIGTQIARTEQERRERGDTPG
jgi:hypothetical protein